MRTLRRSQDRSDADLVGQIGLRHLLQLAKVADALADLQILGLYPALNVSSGRHGFSGSSSITLTIAV